MNYEHLDIERFIHVPLRAARAFLAIDVPTLAGWECRQS